MKLAREASHCSCPDSFSCTAQMRQDTRKMRYHQVSTDKVSLCSGTRYALHQAKGFRCRLQRAMAEEVRASRRGSRGWCAIRDVDVEHSKLLCMQEK